MEKKCWKIVWMDGKVPKARTGVAFEFFGEKPMMIKFYESEGSEPYIIGTTYFVALEPSREEGW